MNLQRGVTSIEYALMAALIALAIIVGAGSVGTALGLTWGDVAAKVAAAMTT